MTSVLIRVKNLRRICNPYTSCWEVHVSKNAVTEALLDGRLADAPGGNDHAARIAFLVRNPAQDAIEIDVGIPSLGYFPDWIVVDGNHRLAAAIYAKREYIFATVAGDVDYAKQILF